MKLKKPPVAVGMSFNRDKCEYIATNKEELDKHEGLQHVQAEHYLCYLCHKEFLLKNGVIKHAEDKHKKELDGQFFCMSCWNLYYNKKDDKEQHNCSQEHGARTKP
ncbi:hypothetical protein PS1_001888 [Malus domestica]